MKKFWLFSEAIRAGAAIRPQAFGDPSVKTRSGSSCAIEAGVEAIRGRFRVADSGSLYRFAKTAFSYLKTDSACPACATAGYTMRRELLQMIWHLNDFHEWTREEIAAWLESEEEKLGLITTVIVESEQQRSSSQVVAVGV